MSRLQLAGPRATRARRAAILVAVAAVGGSFGALGAQTPAGASEPEATTCESEVIVARTTEAAQEDLCQTPEEDYRVCSPVEGSDPVAYEEKLFGSGSDRDAWIESHPGAYRSDKKECPEAPPAEEEPPVVVPEQPQQQQAAAAPAAQQQAAAPVAQAAPSLNAPRRCASRRNFRIRVRTRKADPVVSAAVLVNGKKVRVVRGARLTAPVRLAGLPKGRYSVSVAATTKSGRKLAGKRQYFTCTPKSPRRTTPKL